MRVEAYLGEDPESRELEELLEKLKKVGHKVKVYRLHSPLEAYKAVERGVERVPAVYVAEADTVYYGSDAVNLVRGLLGELEAVELREVPRAPDPARLASAALGELEYLDYVEAEGGVQDVAASLYSMYPGYEAYVLDAHVFDGTQWLQAVLVVSGGRISYARLERLGLEGEEALRVLESKARRVRAVVYGYPRRT